MKVFHINEEGQLQMPMTRQTLYQITLNKHGAVRTTLRVELWCNQGQFLESADLEH